MHDVARRLLALLATREGEYAEFDRRIDKYQHSLQCAARAQAAGEPADYVVMALFHDVFGGFESMQHGNMAGVTLRPWLSTRALLACYEHPFAMAFVLQGRKETEPMLSSPAYEFVVKYDLPSFDPHYETPSITYFLPLVEGVIR